MYYIYIPTKKYMQYGFFLVLLMRTPVSRILSYSQNRYDTVAFTILTSFNSAKKETVKLLLEKLKYIEYIPYFRYYKTHLNIRCTKMSKEKI